MPRTLHPCTSARERAGRQRRARRERALATATCYALACWLIGETTWPSMPLPDARGLLAVWFLSVGTGYAVGRLPAIALAALLVPLSAWNSGSVFAAVLAVLIACPAALTGLVLGAVWRQAARARRDKVAAPRGDVAATRARVKSSADAAHGAASSL
jgi:hypothetical protein